MPRKSRRQRGGNLGAGYAVTTQGVYPGSPFYGVVDGSVGNCQAVAPDYALPPGAAANFNGLPGMKGGGRRSRRLGTRSSKKNSRLQRGGRYDGVPVAYSGPVVGNTPMASRIACEAGQGSPQPSPTVPTEPPVSASQTVPVVSAGAGGILGGIMNFFKGGKRRSRRNRMRGGALLAPYSGGIPLEETTAGYSHFMPGQTGAVVQTQSGVPFMINEPSGGRMGESNACLTMGSGTANQNLGNTAMPPSASLKMSGGRRRRRSSRKSRKGRKGRKH